MNITLYNNTSPRIVADKRIIPVGYVTGTFRATADVLRPVITLQAGSVPDNCNYIGINDFGRFYYVESSRMITTDLIELSLYVDVRKSFITEFLDNSGIVDRQTNNYDMYLKDNKIPCSAKKALTIKKFSDTPFKGNDGTTNLNRVYMLVLGG